MSESQFEKMCKALRETKEENKRLRELLKRCDPYMLILEGATESREEDFWKLVDEVRKEVSNE